MIHLPYEPSRARRGRSRFPPCDSLLRQAASTTSTTVRGPAERVRDSAPTGRPLEVAMEVQGERSPPVPAYFPPKRSLPSAPRYRDQALSVMALVIGPFQGDPDRVRSRRTEH
jgi:hypothetical protein